MVVAHRLHSLGPEVLFMSARKLAILLPVVLVACNQEGLTRDEAVDALTESSISLQG